MNINFFMNKALEEANKAFLLNEVPVGAILIDNNTDKIIQSSHNLVNSLTNATMHAEIVVINGSCRLTKKKFLDHTSLFVTLEPCAMCAAAISEVHIDRIYFGAYDEKKGSLDSIMKIYNNNRLYTPEIYGGINELECSLLLKKFFINKRKK